MTENYLALLEESLRKKLQVMAEIQKYNLRQQETFQSGKADIDCFDEYVAEKGALIDKLTALDSGFEKLYKKVAEQLEGNREKYAMQIKTLQTLVAEVTDTGVQIQAQEVRNKKLIEDYFRKEREGIRMGRKSSNVAIGYYKTMSGTAVIPPHFMDSKK